MRFATRSTVRLVVASTSLAMLTILAARGFAWQRGEARQAPRFEGTTIPDPPKQREAWQPPETSLPKFLVNASTALFEQALADPRGCEFREIEVGIGNVWSGDGGVAKAHGWVLPAAEGQKARFAVAWNGLVYPTASIGNPVDPAADVEAMVKEVRAIREAQAKQPGRQDYGFSGFGTNNESSAISSTSLHPVKVCLLLRLGRADLAEAVWAAGTGLSLDRAERKAKPKLDLTTYKVSYVSLANDLAWYLFDRAICAHMRGDDAIALLDARKLTAFQDAAKAKARTMGFDSSQTPSGQTSFFGFLGQLPELLADHERRAVEPKRGPVPPPEGDKKARIAALIADLDQIAARQMSQPGGVSVNQSSAVQALVKEGNEAIEPLLEALGREDRLTRTVGFHRDFGRSRYILGASQGEFAALCGIMETSTFGPVPNDGSVTMATPQGRKAFAAQIRDYWKKNQGVSIFERYYRTLADDHASRHEWLQAAALIAQPAAEPLIPDSTALVGRVRMVRRDGISPRDLSEAALRQKKDPSVGELIARRANQIDPGGPFDPKAPETIDLRSANQMAMLLAEWDGKAALPLLKARMARSIEVSRAGQAAGLRVFGLEAGIAILAVVRTRLGDAEALDDYAAWVRTLTPDHFVHVHSEILEPLWRNPDRPAMAAAAAAMFEDPKSPWNFSKNARDSNTSHGFGLELIGTPMLGLKEFRALVVRTLGDKSQVGTIEVGDGAVTVIQGGSKRVSNRDMTSYSASSNEQKAPKPGPGAMPLRVCDQAAAQLAALPGVPRFRSEWPVADRDRAIAAQVAFLSRFGERYRQIDATRAIIKDDPSFIHHPHAILAFEPLDRPASARDVAEGRAIFSLEGAGGEVRRASMPKLPLSARWMKLVVYPDDEPSIRSYTSDGKEVPATDALQTGMVWQAEEVREGDRWRRYYGFVGRNAVTRVPAEEVEFPASWRDACWPIAEGLGARATVKPAGLAGPIPVVFTFRNLRGLDGEAPSDLVRDGAGSPSIREGISFRLVRISDKEETNPFDGRGKLEEKPFPPEEIPARPFARHPRGASTTPLAPAEMVDSFTLDLRKLFQVDKPGIYRLEIGFDDFRTEEGKPGKVEASFPVALPKAD